MSISPTAEALIGTTGVSLLALIGISTLWLSDTQLNRLIPPILALAIGALLGDAGLHLIPYGLEKSHSVGSVILWVAVGVALFGALEFGLTKFRSKLHGEHVLPIGPLSLVANGIHNFIDGALIGAAFLGGPAVGGPTLLAVALHEVPHEAANYGILLHAGYCRRRAILLNFGVGLAAILGAAASLTAGAFSQAAASVTLPITAGCFIYMSCVDLLPAVHHRTKGKNLLWPIALFLAGMAIMLLLLLIEH